MDEILSSLKDAGLNTVSLEPLTLKEMEKQNLITVYKESELAPNYCLHLIKMLLISLIAAIIFECLKTKATKN